MVTQDALTVKSVSSSLASGTSLQRRQKSILNLEDRKRQLSRHIHITRFGAGYGRLSPAVVVR